ncbi:FG-GAP repeat domain-containing protein [Pareuzebyella sediminis]|uniref:FG-GAP repeat domain-containing protein n=1 Tax=Pareuzebyella sediminis TaxID=2607998 RepID=UPI0011EE49B1|nr:VCBS repeat-containing protein [Pareuzebyella sediminis]
MKLFVCLISLTFLASACKEPTATSSYREPKATDLNGRQLAEIHCARCHSFVAPQKLTKSIWEEDVLPAMGHRLGMYGQSGPPDSLFGSPRNAEIVKKAKFYPEHPLMADVDWKKIQDFYLLNAPESLSPPKRVLDIHIGLPHFKYQEIAYGHRPPMTAMVKIRSHGRGLIFSDGKPKNNMLTFLDEKLNLEKNILTKNTAVQIDENADSLYLTSIGNTVFPNDFPDGTLQTLTHLENENQRLEFKTILAHLQRPVHVSYGDVIGDTQQDLVVCEYGDLTGKLVVYEKKSGSLYEPHILKHVSGAIKTVIKDQNQDGRNDIMVLMAQGDEGIFYFENKGAGLFEEKRLLTFSPLNGSQNFELVDLNNDGFDDIVYVCGDNADKTPILKEYHGIYLFLNDGKLNFEQAYFFPLNGAYKAIPEDFDGDGDIDIASISFFPDYRNHPEESFVYLENMGNLTFRPYSFAESNKGRWIVMDAGDIDSDGDIDLALGSFVYFLAKDDTTGLSKRWLTESPSVILLENTTK